MAHFTDTGENEAERPFLLYYVIMLFSCKLAFLNSSIFWAPVVGKTFMRTTLKPAQFASQNFGKIVLPGKAWLTTCLLTRWKSNSWSCRALASCTSRAENALIKKKKERQIIKGFLKRRTSHVPKLIMQMCEKV